MGRDTAALLREFREQGSETAFQELVNRYINLVYTVACRRVGGDTHLAEDVVQMVFTDLARKARSLAPDVMLGGWLHRHTCFVASTIMRTNRRRLEREQLSLSMSILTNTADPEWKELAPVLDEAINQLPDLDRMAVLMRFFEHRDLRAIGDALGASDDAAQKRVSRALEKLRGLLVKRGVALGVPALAAAMASQSVSAAPSAMGVRIGKRALEQAAIPVGVLTVLLSWLTPSVVKTALISVALLGLVSALLWPRLSPSNTPAPASIQTQEDGSAGTPRPTSGTESEVGRGVPAEPLVTNGLRLLILAADSGKPIPNAQLSLRVWEPEFVGRKSAANREGICNIPVARDEITHIEITTRAEGFADARLEWRPPRGEQIPESHTLRLTRPVPIGGRVLDPDGQPIAGAKVGWNHEEDPTSKTAPESHEFGWIEVPTDEEGRWRINRIAPGMLRRLYGSARHSEHAGSSHVFVAHTPQAEKALRDGTHVFTLGRATTVTGVVIDPDEQPVPGATVLVGSMGNADRRQGTAGPDGSFVVAGCRPGDTTLSAEAPGFATTTLAVNLTTDSPQSFRVQLKPGRKLTLRVVDTDGAPVSGARLWLNTFGRTSQRGTIKPPQANFSRNTDTNGIVVWESAPQSGLTFDASRRGYMRTSDVEVRSDESEKTIVLQPALQISGKVQDETGQPIPRFRVILGWPERDGLRRIVGPRWSTIERFWLNFSGGEFRHVLEEQVISGTRNPGYVFKIEAEGYTPFVSRFIEPEETKAWFDVTLRRSTGQVVTVLLPSGEPAANADVGLASPGSSLEVVPGGFSRVRVQDLTALLRTDARGQFRFHAEPPRERIIAAHPQGYGEASPGTLSSEPVIQLRPWGHVEGTYLINGQPAAARRLLVNLANGSYNTVRCAHQYEAKTDAAGRFAFKTVPPGRLKIVELVPEVAEKPEVWSHVDLQEVTVEPGQTVQTRIELQYNLLQGSK